MTANPGTADPGDRLAGEARYRRFLDALLVGDVAYCRAEVQAWLDAGRGVRALYEDLIQRALYDVGMLWESGRASVADEHLATAISESLLNLSYPYLFDRPSTGCSALVTCAANEHHQIGARMVADIFELQDQVTARVVGALSPRLEQAEIERAKHKPTGTQDAYDCFLRGMDALHRFTRAGNAAAPALFARAIALDPDYASAYGMAARCYLQRKAFGWVIDRARARKVKPTIPVALSVILPVLRALAHLSAPRQIG